MDARMGILEHFVLMLVKRDILEQTVPGNVHLTVNLTHVDIRMDHVLVLQAGWVIIVLQNVCFPLETNASIHAVFTVLTRSVIESTVAVCMAVKKGNNVIFL